jgi:hypothetical protein
MRPRESWAMALQFPSLYFAAFRVAHPGTKR